MTCAEQGRGWGRRSPARAAAVRLAGELVRPCGALCPRGPGTRRGGDRGGVRRAWQQVLRAALGDDAARVRWQAGDVSYGRLGCDVRRVPTVPRRAARRRVAMRLLAQNDTLGTPRTRMAAYLRFEAMANEVYRPYGYRWACLYDTRTHSTQTLRQVSQVHPRLLERRGPRDPQRRLPRAQQLPARSGPPPRTATCCGAARPPVTDPGQLVVFRRLLRRWADLHGWAITPPAIAASRSGKRSPTPFSTGPHRCGCGPGQPTGWPGCTCTTAARHRSRPPPATTGRPRARPRPRALDRPPTRRRRHHPHRSRRDNHHPRLPPHHPP